MEKYTINSRLYATCVSSGLLLNFGIDNAITSNPYVCDDPNNGGCRIGENLFLLFTGTRLSASGKISPDPTTPTPLAGGSYWSSSLSAEPADSGFYFFHSFLTFPGDPTKKNVAAIDSSVFIRSGLAVRCMKE